MGERYQYPTTRRWIADGLRLPADNILAKGTQFEVAAEVAADSDADADADAVKEIWVSFFSACFCDIKLCFDYLQPLNCQILYTIKMLPLNSVVTARLRQMRRLLLL